MTEGRLFAVVGPSGVGKDTLMQAVARRRPGVHLLRRVITRPEAAGGEDFEGVPEAEFIRRLGRGDFVLDWRAHGLAYGIPARVRARLAEGHPVLFSGSRAMLAQAARVFPDLTVVHVTARAEVLADRLAERGRETPEEIARRLERANVPLPEGLGMVETDNSGALEVAVERLASLLQPVSGCRPSRWNIPASSSPKRHSCTTSKRRGSSGASSGARAASTAAPSAAPSLPVSVR